MQRESDREIIFHRKYFFMITVKHANLACVRISFIKCIARVRLLRKFLTSRARMWLPTRETRPVEIS